MRRRPDMAVTVDDAGHHVFAREIDDRGTGGGRYTLMWRMRTACKESGPPHHRGDEVFDRGRAHLLHHGGKLDAQQFEHAFDAGLPERAQARFGRRATWEPP
jgi:hypothetical protein